MHKLIEFLMELTERLSFSGPMEKRITLRYLQADALQEVTLEGRDAGAVDVKLRPHLLIRERGPGAPEPAPPRTVPLGAVVEITVEEWDLEEPESVITNHWIRDHRGRLRPVIK